MKRMTAVLILLAVTAGCVHIHRKAVVPRSPETEAAAYLEGFRDGYIGVHPSPRAAGELAADHSSRSYHAGLKDGYIAGRKDEQQRE